MQIVIGAIGILAIAILGYLSWVLMKEEYAFQLGVIKSNPADRVEKPRKAQYKATIYNQEELDVLFKVARGDPLELPIILGAFYGLRRSEVAGLKWDAIDFERKTLTIQHTVVEVKLDGKSKVIQKDTTKQNQASEHFRWLRPLKNCCGS